jgi:hypothetical protein
MKVGNKLTDDEKIKVLNGNDLYSIMQTVLLREEAIDQDREHFWVVGLANNNRILFIYQLFLQQCTQRSLFFTTGLSVEEILSFKRGE